MAATREVWQYWWRHLSGFPRAEQRVNWTMIERLQSEIENVHAFIAAWFRGEVARDDALFEAHLAGRLDAELINIQPSGQILTRDQLITGIRAGYGGNPNFTIDVGDVALQFADRGLALVTYVEQQRGAKNTVPADNRRVSSVWFREVSGNNAPVWLHIHETGLD